MGSPASWLLAGWLAVCWDYDSNRGTADDVLVLWDGYLI